MIFPQCSKRGNESPIFRIVQNLIRDSLRRLLLALFYLHGARLFGQEPFQFPTANHNLFIIGSELKFFAPTAPDKPWTSGSFGCVRNDGQRLHEGLDILHSQNGKRGEPTDPIMAAADGTVVYFSTKP
jgi:hypothetical protein